MSWLKVGVLFFVGFGCGFLLRAIFDRYANRNASAAYDLERRR